MLVFHILSFITRRTLRPFIVWTLAPLTHYLYKSMNTLPVHREAWLTFTPFPSVHHVSIFVFSPHTDYLYISGEMEVQKDF